MPWWQHHDHAKVDLGTRAHTSRFFRKPHGHFRVHWEICIYIYGGFLKIVVCIPKMDGLNNGNPHKNGMIWGYHHLRKHPYVAYTPVNWNSNGKWTIGRCISYIKWGRANIFNFISCFIIFSKFIQKKNNNNNNNNNNTTTTGYQPIQPAHPANGTGTFWSFQVASDA